MITASTTTTDQSTNTSTNTSLGKEPVVQIQYVWKLIGDRANEALNAIEKENLSKAEVLERYEAVVGVRDVSFDVVRPAGI